MSSHGELDAPPLRAPLFLCGIGRSGTSYIRTLLNASHKIHLTFEARMLKEGATLYPSFAHDPTPDRMRVFLDQLVDCERETDRNTELINAVLSHQDELFHYWEQHQTCGDVLGYIYYLAYEHEIWGDKILRIETVRSLIDVWPDTRVIVLYRDPRAAVASQKLKWNSTVQMTAGYWNTHYNIAKQLAESMPDRIHELTFRDQAMDPLETLTGVLNFVAPGLESEAAEIIEQLPPRKNRVDNWRKVLTKAEIEEIEALCFHGMQSLGYDIEIATKPKHISKARYLLENIWSHRSHLLRPGVMMRKNALRRVIEMSSNANVPAPKSDKGNRKRP